MFRMIWPWPCRMMSWMTVDVRFNVISQGCHSRSRKRSSSNNDTTKDHTLITLNNIHHPWPHHHHHNTTTTLSPIPTLHPQPPNPTPDREKEDSHHSISSLGLLNKLGGSRGEGWGWGMGLECLWSNNSNIRRSISISTRISTSNMGMDSKDRTANTDNNLK